jgi:hypothetical protein
MGKFAGMITALPLTLPLVIAAGAALTWWSWRRFANPPRFSGYPVRIRWMVDPIAWLDRDLRNGRLAPGISAVLGRLLQELNQYHHLSNQELYRWFRPYRISRDPLLLRAWRLVRRLDDAYRLADLAEDPRLTDLWSRWRRPVRKARAGAIFEEGFREVRAIWPQLEAAR